jgi:hypothetical protein
MAWYNQSWNKRKQITITGVSGAGAGYQVLLKIGASTSATDYDFIVNSVLFPSGKNNGGDLRFTSSDEVTSIPFWVEKVVGSGSTAVAHVWVKVSEDLSSNRNIFCYYDNSEATNSSNGANTFSFFDDFNSSTLNSNLWIITDADQVAEKTDGFDINASSNSLLRLTSTESKGRRIFSKTNFGRGKSVVMGGCRIPTTTSSYHWSGIVGGKYISSYPVVFEGASFSYLLCHWESSGNSRVLFNKATSGGNTFTNSSVNFHNTSGRHEHQKHKDGRIKLLVDGSVAYNDTGFADSEGCISAQRANSGGNGNYELDYVFAREFNDTEPVFNTAHSEEDKITFTITTLPVSNVTYTSAQFNGEITGYDE